MQTKVHVFNGLYFDLVFVQFLKNLIKSHIKGEESKSVFIGS